MSAATMTAPVATSSQSSSSRLEPLLLLAKSTKPRGAAAAHLIQQAISLPGVYFFGELLQLPGVAELSSSSETNLRQSYELLQLFAYGTWAEYRSLRLELIAELEYKLRQLTLLSLASQTKVLPYADLFSSLEIEPTRLRQLEDLIIESTYAGLISGKLNQLQSRFEVHHVQGRDVAPSSTQLAELHSTLSDWHATAQNVLASLETKMQDIKSSAQNNSAQQSEHNSNLLAGLFRVQELASQTKGKSQAQGSSMDMDDLDTQTAFGRSKKGQIGRGSKRSRA